MATLDVVTVSEAAQFLQQPGAVDLLPGWITAVSLRLDLECGSIVERSMGTETYDGGTTRIFVKEAPIYSVSSVVEYTPGSASGTTLTASTNSSIAANGYLLQSRVGRLTRVVSGIVTPFMAGTDNIEVTYHSGRYANTAAVSAQFKQAALVCISHLWQAEHGTRNSTFGGPEDGGSFGPGWAIPKRALDILGAEVRPRIGIA